MGWRGGGGDKQVKIYLSDILGYLSSHVFYPLLQSQHHSLPVDPAAPVVP